MATASWVAELDKKEHKNWVMVGCALNIAKNGITQLIQGKMEAWYQSLNSSPPLQSLAPCTCVPLSPKCGTCVIWETELKRYHKSKKPKICWDNSDRKQWGSPTGAWEIAKLFMPTLGTRKTQVIDADTTDMGGLLNLLEWCPFINPSVSRTVLSSARDQCRNHWAHAPKQELQDADVKNIFSHLNSLLNDPVYNADKASQQSSKDLQDLFHHGLVNVRESEVEALHLLRQSLVADLTKCRDDLADVQDKVVQSDAESRKVSEAVQKQISEVKEQGECSRKEIAKLRQELDTEVREKISMIDMILKTVENFNTLVNERKDLRGAFSLISEDVEYLRNEVQNVFIELTTTKSQVAELEIGLTGVRSEVKGVAIEVATNTNTISGLQKHVMEVKEDVETLKAKPSQGQNDDEIDTMCTAPSRLTAFTGRESALAWLEQSLVSDQSPEDCRTKAICGLGGCGKTSLAVEFAWRCTSNFPGGVFWINGESDENIRKSVVENLSLLNIPASTSEDVDDILNRFLALLSKKKLPWLLVVDNADELQDPTCPTGVKKICKGPWQRNSNASRLGHLLYTTRQNTKDTKTFLKLSSDDCLELQCFSEEEGALFLMQRTGSKRDSLDTEAILLVNELGALPLALEQAAAYISALPIPCSFKAYLDKYRAVKLRLLKQQSATALSVEAQHRLSVHTTWEINFEFVTEKSPAAATMMRIAAFLESEDIPIDVINRGFPELDQVKLRDAANSVIDIAAILKVLTSYSLFSVNQQRRVFSVHKLVQEVVRDSLTISARIESLVAATRVLHFAFLENSKPCFELAKHVQSRNLSATKDEDRNILVALLLNFCKLKKHLEDELTTPKGNQSIEVLFNDDTSNLCSLVCDLCKNNISLYRLSSDLVDFNWRVSSIVHAEDDPDLLLWRMLNTSISKRNCPSPESYKDSKELSENTVQKLVELEKSGAAIAIDIKYMVLQHRASYYALEGQWEKNYKALLKLEDLPLSDKSIVDLQMCIGRAENYVSSCNFKFVLRRYENALKIARRIYPPDHPELLRLLQFINRLFYNEGKLNDAKPYAEEMLEICKKLPSSSDHYIKGMASALQVINEFDPISSENMLLETLKDRWPHIYKSAKEGYFDANGKTIVDDGSDVHLAEVLNGVMECLVVIARTKRNFSTRELNFYRTIAEILFYIRKRFYGDIHPGMVGAYGSLATVHKLLKNFEEVLRLQELVSKCRQGQFKQLYQSAPCDSKMYDARRQKNFGENLFRAGIYSGALQCYNQALTCFPNDAKLFTNRSATYVQLSKQQSSADDERKYLEHALQDSHNAIAADPSWVKGYYRKAVCLAHLGKRGPSLAAAAVAKHLFPSQCAKIPAVVDRFGSYDAQVVTTVQDLLHVTERANTRNIVVVVKEGRYELQNPLKIPQNAVIVGHGKVLITCSKAVPLKLDKTVYMKNITLSPTMESIKKLKEKAKRCFDHGQVDAALSLYNEALILSPNDPQILTSIALTYLKSAEQNKDRRSERKSLLELALNSAEAAITADSTWLLGYYTKAASLTELDRKQQALAAAAVFKHLSSGRDFPGVAQRYGGLQVQVVESSDQLRCVFERIKELEGVNQVVLMKEGEYLLEKSVQISQQIVIVGQGQVTVSCKIGAPFRFTQACHVENVQIIGDCDNDQEPQDCNSNDTQSEVIALDTPSGYEHNECKVN